MVDKAGRGASHRYYVIEDGNHVDQLADLLPTVTRPMLPCYYDALVALDAWVERGSTAAAGRLRGPADVRRRGQHLRLPGR